MPPVSIDARDADDSHAEQSERARTAPSRPLLACALAALTGSLLGFGPAPPGCAASSWTNPVLTEAGPAGGETGAALGTPPSGGRRQAQDDPGRPLAGAWVATALGAAAALAVARRRARRRSSGTRPPALSWWLLPLALLSALRARCDRSLPPARDAPGHAELAEARVQPLVGRWRASGVRRGWVDEDTSGPVRLLLDCEGPAPPDGTRVAVLPGEEALPWPRGPEPGPRAREGRFHAQASLRPDELCVLDPWPAPGLLARWREAWVRRLEECDRRADAGGLVPALLLGSTRALSHEMQERFGRTGTRHILSVSGLHVGLVTWVAALCTLRLAGSPRARRRVASTLGILTLYAALTGAQPPVVRAALAGGLFLLAPFLGAPRGARAGGRRPDGLSLWSLALLLELARDPLAAQRVGVQLSYLATLGLLIWNRSRKRWSGPRASTTGLPCAAASARAALVRPLAGSVRVLVLSTQASCAAVLAGLPIVWNTFGEWSPLGVVATPLSMPFVFLLMVLGAAECLAPGLVPAPLVRALAGLLVALFDALDLLPGTPVPLPPRPLVLVALAAGATFVALTGHERWRSAARRAACWLWACLLVPWSLAPRGLELVALDVGAGTCVVARAPGLPALVFDAGSRNRHDLYGEALGPLLRAWDVASPVVVLSHLDRDHASALEPLVTRHPPRLWAGPLPDDVPLSDATPRLDVGRGSLELPLAAGLEARLLRGSEEPGNEGSRSLLLGDARTGRILLCGDAEGPGLSFLLRAPLVRGPLLLLLLPHHGSQTPELGRLLSELAPAEVWISAEGEPAVAPELTRRGLAWRATGRTGPLLFPRPAGGDEKPATAAPSGSSVP